MFIACLKWCLSSWNPYLAQRVQPPALKANAELGSWNNDEDEDEYDNDGSDNDDNDDNDKDSNNNNS